MNDDLDEYGLAVAEHEQSAFTNLSSLPSPDTAPAPRASHHATVRFPDEAVEDPSLAIGEVSTVQPGKYLTFEEIEELARL